MRFAPLQVANVVFFLGTPISADSEPESTSSCLAEVFPDVEIVQSLIAQLGWTHILHLIRIDDGLKRDFYAVNRVRP